MSRFSPGLLYPQAAAAGLSNLTYQGESHQNNSATATWTFSSYPIGTAASDRWVVVAFACHNSAARTLNSITIGGVSASIILSQGSVNLSSGLVGIAIANVPTGTTANIVFTFSSAFTASTSNGVGINGYTVNGPLNSTPVDTYQVDGVPGHTFNVNAGGFVIATGVPTNASHNVSGDFTTDDNFVQYAAALALYAGHFDNTAGGATTATFTGTGWLSTHVSFCGASFGT